MTTAPTRLSDDQAQAFDAVSDVLASAGVDLVGERLQPPGEGRQSTLAILGKAGSGKTMLLARLVEALSAAGV